MKTADFSYELPPDRIAQSPASPRDHSRLLALDRKSGTLAHRRFFELGEFLRPGDLLVANASKVFKARLRAHLPGRDGKIEIFLLRPDGDAWIALGKPGRKLLPGTTVVFGDGSTARILEKIADGTLRIDFGRPADEIFTLAERLGDVPLPPYIAPSEAASGYQTVYADKTGSVAAPTAGLHFTPELIATLKARGIGFATVTLHVGLGTFRPMTAETLEEHVMHEEWFEIPAETREAVARTKANGGRVVAVGTTSVRALESGAEQGSTRLFITPGFAFKTVDAMITNFHLPQSTLLVLVSSFIGAVHPEDPDAGRRIALAAYADAIREGYRFYSFGDAMLIY